MINSQQAVPGSSSNSPTATTNGDTYLVAWKAERDSSIWWTSCAASSGQESYDWKKPTQLTNVGTSAGPALASLNGKAWLAWKGEGSDTRIFLSSLSGSEWSAAVAAPKLGTSAAPALAATDGNLYLAFKGESDDQIYWSKSADGKTWTAAEALKDVLSSDTPALAAFKGNVYLAIRGRSDTHIWWTTKKAGGGWDAATALASTFETSVGPALAVGDSGLLHLAWKSTADDSISTASWFSGDGAWSAVTKIPVVETVARPALAFQGSPATAVLLAFKGKSNGVFVGPLDALATEQTQGYDFVLNQFQIKNTRSGNIFSTSKDTVYASLALTVGKSAPKIVTQSMGNLSNGVYPTTLSLRSIKIADNEKIVLSYQIINSSQGEANASTYLQQAAEKISAAGVSALATAAGGAVGAAIGAALGTAIPVPLIGSALGALAGWLVGSFWGIAFPNCDGPVAAAVHVFTGAELRKMTATNFYDFSEDNPGVSSPDGCGSNSDYVVTWSVGVG